VAVGNEGHRAILHRLVLAALILLLASSLAAVLVQWSGTPSVLLALVLLVPLLAPLRGILRGDRRTHAWATLCIVPGFIYGLTEAVANPAIRTVAALVLGSSLALFLAIVAYLRVTRPQAYQPPPSA
jgi:uncharacterized membrane protein